MVNRIWRNNVEWENDSLKNAVQVLVYLLYFSINETPFGKSVVETREETFLIHRLQLLLLHIDGMKNSHDSRRISTNVISKRHIEPSTFYRTLFCLVLHHVKVFILRNWKRPLYFVWTENRRWKIWSSIDRYVGWLHFFETFIGESLETVFVTV